MDRLLAAPPVNPNPAPEAVRTRTRAGLVNVAVAPALVNWTPAPVPLPCTSSQAPSPIVRLFSIRTAPFAVAAFWVMLSEEPAASDRLAIAMEP